MGSETVSDWTKEGAIEVERTLKYISLSMSYLRGY